MKDKGENMKYFAEQIFVGALMAVSFVLIFVVATGGF